jgi:hypothetical protein
MSDYLRARDQLKGILESIRSYCLLIPDQARATDTSNSLLVELRNQLDEEISPPGNSALHDALISNVKDFCSQVRIDKEGVSTYDRESSINAITVAMSYNKESNEKQISKKKLSDFLGLNRRTIKLYSDVMDSDSSISDESETEDEVIRARIYTDGQNRINNDQFEEDDDSHSQSSDSISSGSQSASVEQDDGDISDDDFEETLVSDTGTKKKKRPTSTSELLAQVKAKTRLPRSDKRLLVVADVFWHASSQLNTNSKNHVTLSIEGIPRVCKEHIQSTDTKDLYLKFLNSQQYAEYLSQHPGKSIGMRLFEYAKCKCIVHSKQLDCADTTRVGLDYALVAIRRMLKAIGEKTCTCFFHADKDAAIMKIKTKSAESFAFCLMCPTQEAQHLARKVVPVDASALPEDDKTVEDVLRDVLARSMTKTLQSSNVPRRKLFAARLRKDEKKTLQGVKSGRFFIPPKLCSQNKCPVPKCGTKQLSTNSERCPYLWDDDDTVSYRKLVEVPLSGKMQKQFVEVMTTRNEFMVYFVDLLRNAMSHLWSKKWDIHNRDLLCYQFPQNVALVHFDYSAIYSIVVQNRQNCAFDEHVSQFVACGSINPRELISAQNPVPKRVMFNTAYHIWSKKIKWEQAECHYSIYKYLQRIIRDLIDKQRRCSSVALKRFILLCDGAGPQAKNKYFTRYTYELLIELDLDEIIIIYAPTSCFKCIVDGLGQDCKLWHRRKEREQAIRDIDALHLYMTISSKMPKVVPESHEKKNLMGIDERKHFYCVDTKHGVDVIKSYDDYVSKQIFGDRDLEDVLPNIIYTDRKSEEINVGPMHGIQSIFSVRVNKSNPDKAFMRDHYCACQNCLEGNYSECESIALIGDWREIDLRKVPVKVSVQDDFQNLIDFLNLGGKTKSNVHVFVCLVKSMEGVDETLEGLELAFAILKDLPRKNKSEPLAIIPDNPDKLQYEVGPKEIFITAVPLVPISQLTLDSNPRIFSDKSVSYYQKPVGTKKINAPLSVVLQPFKEVDSSVVLTRENFVFLTSVICDVTGEDGKTFKKEIFSISTLVKESLEEQMMTTFS